MNRIFCGKRGAILAFVGIVGLVLGGLGWATREALCLEEEQQRTAENALRLEEEKRRAAETAFRFEENERINTENRRRSDAILQKRSERADQLRIALWRLDTRLMPALAREDSRPYAHYVALNSPFPALTKTGVACDPGQFYLPSPLMTADLPPWMLLHFQVDPVNGWMSPQVIPDDMKKLLRKQPLELNIDNVNEPRAEQLVKLKGCYPAGTFLKSLPGRGVGLNPNQPSLQPEFNPAYGQSGGQRNPLPQQTVIPTNNTNSNPEQNQTQVGSSQNTSEQNDAIKFNDIIRRFQMNYRSKLEGANTYWSEGRHIAPLENIYPSKVVVKTTQPVEVMLGSMHPIWLPSWKKPEHLVLMRPAQVGNKSVYQGILLDWKQIEGLLKEEIIDLFPDAKLVPLPEGNPEQPEQSMALLPIRLDVSQAEFTGEPELPLPSLAAPETVEAKPIPALGWTPLRIGLVFAWGAAILALIAVGLGGWSLLDLSERRIRFVSAVTHELRTPLTTLRLYLDLLTSGMIREEQQKAEYLNTLNGEAERLYRLINNVLDFARLEKSRPTIEKRLVVLTELLEQVRTTWSERCAASGKDLKVANALPSETMLTTDRNLVEQILGNLVDNARKYSQDAADPTIWLRTGCEGGHFFIEVEDCGPGVSKPERRSIFRPFRRGRVAEVQASGGVGLGLALATRWASFVGGTLTVKSGANGIGACFRLELPTGTTTS